MELIFSKEAGRARCWFVFNNGEVLGHPQPEKTLALALKWAKEQDDFGGEANAVCTVSDLASGTTMLLAGLGDKDAFTHETLRRSASQLVRACCRKKLKSVSVGFADPSCLTKELARALAESLVMSGYRYTACLSKPQEEGLDIAYLDLPEALVSAAKEGALLGAAVREARELVNEPANIQTPLHLAEETQALGKRYGFEVEVLDEQEIKALGMKALTAVAQASVNPPAVIVMRYKGAPESGETLGLIGKAVTYDSGGLNLKAGARFITMKHDMAGSATVIGAMCAIAAAKLSVNVTAVAAACENVIAGNAYKPGDIIGSMGGKTIQVNSTDAEGRLTLIDAMTYAARKEKVTSMADIGTLTGAARRMFGDYGAPYVTTDRALGAKFADAAQTAGELVIEIPLIEDMKEMLRCPVADLLNTAAAEVGGMVTSSLFLREFTEGLPWVHIDAAGPCWLERDIYYETKGGSGWGVRSLYHLASLLAEK